MAAAETVGRLGICTHFSRCGIDVCIAVECAVRVVDCDGSAIIIELINFLIAVIRGGVVGKACSVFAVV